MKNLGLKVVILAVVLLVVSGITGEVAAKTMILNGKEVEMNQLVVDPSAKLPPSNCIQLERVEEIWQKLAATTGFDAMVAYNDDEKTINAYIARDKNDGVHWVVIYLGLLKLFRTEDELAGVFAHEIGHGVGKHGEKKQNNAVGIILGANILSAVLGGGKAVGAALGVGANLAISGYSREQEVEADDYGTEYCAKAGFSPWGLYDAILRMADAGAVTPPSGFNSHPPTERRMSRLRGQAEKWESELSDKSGLPSPSQNEPAPSLSAADKSDKADVIESYSIDAGEKNTLTILHNRSVSFYNAGKFKEALAGFTRAATSYDKNYLAALWAARSAQKLGDNAKMKQWINKALSINPNYEPAKQFKAKFVK